MPDLSSITIVVPTRNEAGNIPLFLESLPAQMPLIVVDKSEDATPDIVQQARGGNTRILYCNGTLTEARQVGAEAAETEFILFTDADVRFSDGYFERLRGLQADVIHGPKLSRDRYRYYYAGIAAAQRVSDWLSIPAATGSNLLVGKSALRAVGGFDTRLTCNEDSELVWRIHRAGYRCRFDPGLVVWATDHRRLERGRLLKTGHSLLRCALLYTGLMPERWRGRDWGYWATANKTSRN
ncbi:MAG: glycosyltransferase, partial [Wenzhouxiangella sp.]